MEKGFSELKAENEAIKKALKETKSKPLQSITEKLTLRVLKK